MSTATVMSGLRHFLHAFACIALLLPAAAASAGDATLAERVQRIEDEKEIRELLVRYGRYLDSLDFKSYSELFARDGEWSGLTTGYTPVRGPAEIRATMEKAFAERRYDPEHITNLHLISNVMIQVDGDRGTGYSRWTVVTRNDKDEPFVRISGRYEDEYVREDGRWKFRKRVARREIP